MSRPRTGECKVDSPVGRSLGAGVERRLARAWEVLESVPDPEVPALSVCDLGIVREVRELELGEATPVGKATPVDHEAPVLEVVLTPTYSGCPATEWIERSIVEALQAAKLGPVQVRLQRAPAWTTDWISAEGRRKMLEAGIVPPAPVHDTDEDSVVRPLRWHPRPGGAAGALAVPGGVSALACPRCASLNTERLAAFGSTACKALHRCLDCGEPFEHFKPL